MEENEKNKSFIEEPIELYCSSSLNQGVRSTFSTRKAKSFKHNNFLFTPTNANNNKFSLCNTIMLPFVVNDISNPEEKNMKAKSNRVILSKETLFSLKKENIKLKLDKSKDINDDKNANNNILEKNESNNRGLSEKGSFKERKSPMEINPFFLGKAFSFSNNNKKDNNSTNIKPIKSAFIPDNLKGDNNKETNDGFLNREKSKSVFCADERNNKKSSIIIKPEDDDKSVKVENKDDKVNDKNSEVKKDKEKVIRLRGLKRKITFNMETKFTKREKDKNKTLDKEQSKRKEKSKDKDKEKEDSIKKKKEKDKEKEKGKNISKTNFKYNITIDKRRQSYYFSNKCITNTFNINFYNTIKKNKLDNSSLDEKNLEKKNSKRKKKLSKTKEELKKYKSNNKYKAYSQSKGITSLKEYIKTKESDGIKNANNDSSSSSKSLEQKNIRVKNKRYNSKKELKRINIKRKDSDSEKKEKKKQKLRRGRTFVIEEEDDEDNQNNKNTEKKINDKKEEKDKEEKVKEDKAKKKSSIKQLFVKEKDSNKDCNKDKDNYSDDRNKINKCLTADLRRKKNCSMFEKNIRAGKLSNSSKNKKGSCNMVLNLFGNHYPNKNKNDIDFEFALKNNLKKMQFNLFSKDKFTNTEFR